MKYLEDGVLEKFVAGNTGIECIPNQFTGLIDKNNHEIFEGDIVECTCEVVDKARTVEIRNGGKHIILWDNVQCNFRLNKNAPVNRLCDWDLKIIGNIYENPDLIKTFNGKEAT